MKIRYCPQCGSTIGEKDKFCEHCGAPLQPSARTPAPEEASPLGAFTGFSPDAFDDTESPILRDEHEVEYENGPKYEEAPEPDIVPEVEIPYHHEEHIPESIPETEVITAAGIYGAASGGQAGRGAPAGMTDGSQAGRRRDYRAYPEDDRRERYPGDQYDDRYPEGDYPDRDYREERYQEARGPQRYSSDRGRWDDDFDDYEYEPEPEKKSSGPVIVIVLLVVAVLAIVAFVLFRSGVLARLGLIPEKTTVDVSFATTELTTPEETTTEPPTTPEPTTPAPTTPAPTTPAPTTPAPTTPAPTTPAPTTPAPTTPAPTTPEPTTPEPTTPEPTTPAPTTPAPTTPVNPDDYMIPDSNSRLLTNADLDGKTAEQVRLIRNEIVARAGRKFASADLAAYFGAKSWYHPQYEPDYFDEHTTELLNETEQKNLTMINQYEEAHNLNQG